MIERITLSVELAEGEHDAKANMFIPWEILKFWQGDDKGAWLDNAIDQLRGECRAMLKEKARSIAEDEAGRVSNLRRADASAASRTS